jgi:serine/threonine-protein kinase
MLSHYRVTSAIGAGGMGEVYRATDTKLGRDVALKVLPAEMARDSMSLARFQREARALAALNHPHIVTIFSVDQADGVHFLTMELLEGQALDRLIGGDGLPIGQVLEIAGAIADALDAAHRHGIVHRDLKPANVMVCVDSRVKVLDFGLAKDARTEAIGDATATSDPRTQVGAIMGTPAYMSPEQVAGRSLDRRTDIFSLGVVVHEMATGRKPFAGNSIAELASAILRDTPPSITDIRPDLPGDLAGVVLRCLEKDPDQRPQTARELSNAFRELEDAGSGEATPSGPKNDAPWKFVAIGALAVSIAIAGYFVLHSNLMHSGPSAPPVAAGPNIVRSIAVLPLDNYSGDPKEDYFAEGMTDELTTDLATISQLRVISRGSVMQFTGAHRPPTPEIAKMLNVDAVVEGSVLRSGDRVRITAQLIDARADKHLWAKSFERSSRDVLALQDELASAIANEIHIQLTPTEASRLANAPVVDPEAHDAYLRGRYFFNRPSDENLKKAIEQFEKTVSLSPNFAPAYSGLSDAYLWAGYNEGFLTSAQAKVKAKAAAEKAIELDGNSAEAHTSLAVFELFYNLDWTECENEFHRAFALNPNYAFAHDQFGLGLALRGNLDESLVEGKRAAELDPLDPQIPLDNVMGLGFRGDYQAAREEAKRASELDPSFYFPYWGYGWIDIQTGNVRAAIPQFEKAKTMDAPPFVSAFLAYAYGASGDRTRALAELENLKKISPNGNVLPFNLAIVYLGLGDRQHTLDELERAHAADSQWQEWLGRDRMFDPLRQEPRYIALMKKLGFQK